MEGHGGALAFEQRWLDFNFDAEVLGEGNDGFNTADRGRRVHADDAFVAEESDESVRLIMAHGVERTLKVVPGSELSAGSSGGMAYEVEGHRAQSVRCRGRPR